MFKPVKKEFTIAVSVFLCFKFLKLVFFLIKVKSTFFDIFVTS